MKKSAERIQFITDYIEAYEAKIKVLNKNGLFDAAKLYELFAAKVCNLWFGQEFKNLNTRTANYPYVDLISNDGVIFIQVSTVQNVPLKIKGTLEKIADNKSDEFSKIQKIYFFVLNNESVAKVKDFCGENKIGNIDFIKEENLITTSDIINKATNDLGFQQALYDLLLSDDKNIKELNNRVLKEIEYSKSIYMNEIDCLINGEYEIDRTEMIENIKRSNSQFVSVRGEAGSGKSVVCKKVIENEEYVFYARAERFNEETDINDIWHFDIEEALNYLNNKPVYFFIDSLEFIADAKKSSFDLLQVLYELCSKFSTAKIITSCRSSDETAFIKIDSNYYVECFVIEPLNEEQIYKIGEQYGIIKKFAQDFSYATLLSSPFYINLIVKHVPEDIDISDENTMRNYIWENVICLKEKTKKYDLVFSDIVTEVNKIVFERARKFLLGVDNASVNTKILKALISEGIVIENGSMVRLKYDIFEDICFENKIDSEFNQCRGNYNKFFTTIESLGRCCYRRYQIWISNKILTKGNRDKFLYQLIFAEESPSKWIKETVIGLVKSKYCESFFEEQIDFIISKNMMEMFINVTNLYAFKANVLFSKEIPIIQLTPVGEGRKALIKAIYKKSIFKSASIKSDIVIKLCSDYAKNDIYDSDTSKMSCTILCYYIQKYLSNVSDKYYEIAPKVTPLLNPIYQMSEYFKEWIVDFWKEQKNNLLSTEHDKHRIAEEIIEYTLKNTTVNLAKHVSKELCELAETFWTCNVDNNYQRYYEDNYGSLNYKYGLNRYAAEYDHSLDSLRENRFYQNLLEHNFWKVFFWTIDFINNGTIKYVSQKDDGIKEISLFFVNEKKERCYYASGEMWLAGAEENRVPNLIGDFAFLLKRKIIKLIKTAFENKWDVTDFVNNIKNFIYEKSNNIILFSIIADIGIMFKDELPGYALDLASSIHLISWDIHRFTILNPSKDVEMLKRQMFSAVGVPYFKGRYEDGLGMSCLLGDYVIQMQLINSQEQYCYQILDYLYQLYPDSKEFAEENFQIQKIDVRRFTLESVEEGNVICSPDITGVAKEYEMQLNDILSPQQTLEDLIQSIMEKFDIKTSCVKDVTSWIDLLKDKSDICGKLPKYQKTLNLLIGLALSKDDLCVEKRDEYCLYWLSIVDDMLNYSGVQLNEGYLWVLFRQLDYDIPTNTKYEIKQLIIRIATSVEVNGIISQIKRATNNYMKTKQLLGKALFNTLVMLSVDERARQRFIFENSKHHEEDDVDSVDWFGINSFESVEEHIKRQDKPVYVTKKPQIIEEYFLKETKLNFSETPLEDFDCNILSNIWICGLDFNDDDYLYVVNKLVHRMLNFWNSKKYYRRNRKIITIYSSNAVADMIGNELFDNTNKALDLLFDGVDLSDFSNDSIEFFLSVFNQLLPVYVDSYSNTEKRSKCEKVLLELEKTLENIDYDGWQKKKLYRSLILSVNGYEGDWSKITTQYSYKDIQFLNKIFSKYGEYNFDYLVLTILKMNAKLLLPYILPSIDVAFQNMLHQKYEMTHDEVAILDRLHIIIVLSFLNYQDEIKQDEDLTKAYENLLENLIDLNSEKAAVLLDEFRIH